MFQNKDGDLPESDAAAPEERAYEDNWYRSLKALADQRQDEDAGPEEVETPIDRPVLVASEEPIAQVSETEPVDEAEPVGETEPARGGPVDPPDGTTDRERFVSQEFETRAGQLLERLRSIQNLGDR